MAVRVYSKATHKCADANIHTTLGNDIFNLLVKCHVFQVIHIVINIKPSIKLLQALQMQGRMFFVCLFSIKTYPTPLAYMVPTIVLYSG